MGEHQEDLGDEEAVEAAEGDEVGDDSPAGEVAAELSGARERLATVSEMMEARMPRVMKTNLVL